MSVLQALQFAYLLENLESEFYKAVLGQSATEAQNAAFAPVRAQLASDPAIIAPIRQIAKHEAAHVEFLKAQITALGGAAATYTGAEFDFTGGNGAGIPGPFAAARTDLATLLAVAQLLEDTGVRAYKGQLGVLMADDTILTAALRIHSVEGRHAARIRQLRNVTGLKPWTSGTTTAGTSGITASGAVTAATASIAATTTGFTRPSGRFSTEGFAVGQQITASGFSNAANNGVFVVSAVPAPATTGNSATLSATATGYARTSGSFITNGFAVGQEVTATGFTNPENNGTSRITAVTATALTVNKTVPTVVEAAATGRSITAEGSSISVTRSTPGVAEPAATGRFLLASRGIAPGASTIVARTYGQESNTVHGGIDMEGLGSNTGGTAGVTEAFDEPLTYDDVVFIIQNFVIGSNP